eukprot:7132601-Lingulodinium_polyedra.AAC.1
MDILGAAGMAKYPERQSCPACAALWPVESFFANVYTDTKEFVVTNRLEVQATYKVAMNQPVRAACIDRPYIRAC